MSQALERIRQSCAVTDPRQEKLWGGRRRLWHLHRPYEPMEVAPWSKSMISAAAWPRLIRSRPARSRRHVPSGSSGPPDTGPHAQYVHFRRCRAAGGRAFRKGPFRIDEHRNARDPRQQLTQQRKPLRPKFRRDAADTGNVATGPVEAGNVQIDVRWAAGNPENYRKFAAELLALTPDVILAVTTLAVAALQQASRTVPIVFVQVIDPVSAGFVASMSRPDTNATGFTVFEYGISAKWLGVAQGNCAVSQESGDHSGCCYCVTDWAGGWNSSGCPVARSSNCVLSVQVTRASLAAQFLYSPGAAMVVSSCCLVAAHYAIVTRFSRLRRAIDFRRFTPIAYSSQEVGSPRTALIEPTNIGARLPTLAAPAA